MGGRGRVLGVREGSGATCPSRGPGSRQSRLKLASALETTTPSRGAASAAAPLAMAAHVAGCCGAVG